ncbi:MAG: hypothetical protein K9K64_02135 [Desulfohalobiaceae bacterium]|nr:hypothetical protein [Desulfohalobiaceae bacterium]
MGLDLKDVDLEPGLKGWYRSGLCYFFRSQNPQDKPGASVPQSPSAAAFPEPWSRIFNSRKAECTSVWTYWQLPLDLGPQPSAERKRLFQKIVSALNWPPEHLVFWPLSAFHPPDLLSRTDLFRQGIQLLKPLYVLVFGDQAIEALFPGDKRTAYGLFKMDQIDYIFLPGAEDMLPDNKNAKRIVWNTLKKL